MMKKSLLFAAAFAAALVAPALADVGIRRTPCGYQQITTLSSAQSLTIPTNICAAGTVTFAVITAETQAVRYRDDGTDPTASVGQPLAVGVILEYSGSLSKVKFIAQTGSPVLNISYYR
jgi:ABC-type amino acid transport substrate-binding protein